MKTRRKVLKSDMQLPKVHAACLGESFPAYYEKQHCNSLHFSVPMTGRVLNVETLTGHDEAPVISATQKNSPTRTPSELVNWYFCGFSYVSSIDFNFTLLTSTIAPRNQF